MSYAAEMDPDEFTVIGTSGWLTSSPLNGGSLRILRSRQEVEHEEHPPHANFNAPLIADFVQAIRDDTAPRVCGEEGLRTNAIMEQAYANTSD